MIITKDLFVKCFINFTYYINNEVKMVPVFSEKLPEKIIIPVKGSLIIMELVIFIIIIKHPIFFLTVMHWTGFEYSEPPLL